MAEGKVTITSDGETIELVENCLRNIIVSLDTLDNNSSEKRKAMLARIEITGDITDENQEELRKIFNWAKDFDADTTYRKIVIETSLNKKPLHKYEFDKVFVRDYTEKYTEDTKGENKEGAQIFELQLTQKANNLENAKIV